MLELLVKQAKKVGRRPVNYFHEGFSRVEKTRENEYPQRELRSKIPRSETLVIIQNQVVVATVVAGSRSWCSMLMVEVINNLPLNKQL